MTPADRRTQLLDATLRVVADRGVDRVSIDSVAKAAGVARPVVYKHFADSDALLRASLEREEQRATEQYLRALATPNGAGAEAVRELYANLLDEFAGSPDLWRAVLVLADSTTGVFRRRVEKGRELAAVRLEELLGSLLPESIRSALDIPLTARMLLAAIIESGRLLLSDADRYPRERLQAGIESVVGIIEAGVR